MSNHHRKRQQGPVASFLPGTTKHSILTLVGKGLTKTQIAQELGVDLTTVTGNLKAAKAKLGDPSLSDEEAYHLAKNKGYLD